MHLIKAKRLPDPLVASGRIQLLDSLLDLPDNVNNFEHHKTLSLKILNVEFDVGYSTLGFTT